MYHKTRTLDILILNGGLFAYQANKLGELEVDDFQCSFTINTVAPIILVQGLKDNLLRGEVKKLWP
ncbi:MAG: hypothetical protein BGO76_02545 [Caedibacter sp. 38-128]|nr:MAG: hypothetical protein BGO76_02545 [Caedibacter sp. 38-128]